jgi:hypothetical protein
MNPRRPTMAVTLSAETVANLAIGGFAALVGWLAYMHMQIDGIKVSLAETKVQNQTLWDFQLRRGAVEAVGAGMATKNSPLVVKETAALLAEELGPDLRRFYANLGRPNMTNAELAFQIERFFGSVIADKVCIPNGVSYGACLLIAMAVAKGDPVIDI